MGMVVIVGVESGSHSGSSSKFAGFVRLSLIFRLICRVPAEKTRVNLARRANLARCRPIPGPGRCVTLAATPGTRVFISQS